MRTLKDLTQDECIKIHSKFGMSEMANYKIQLLFDSGNSFYSVISILQQILKDRSYSEKSEYFSMKSDSNDSYFSLK
jgi:hypothetical protein